MRPRILHELSQHLVALLEEGLRGAGGSERIPVYLCHPLDPIEVQEEAGRTGVRGGALGILYPTRISPENRWRQMGFAEEPIAHRAGASRDLTGRIRFPALWVRLRYVFLVTGGGVEEQLGGIAAALRTIHDHPYAELDLASLGEEYELSPWEGLAGPPRAAGAGRPDLPRSIEPARAGPTPGATPTEPAGSGPLAPGETEAPPSPGFPLRIVDDPEAWREIGLGEHRLTVSFEVTVPIFSTRVGEVSRVLEREIRFEETPP